MPISFPDIANNRPDGTSLPYESIDKQGWKAQLKLRYAYANRKTILREQHHTGPLLVQKPFYPEGPKICHTYLIHPPGGVVGGDKLGVQVHIEPGAHAVITTPAAGKFYRSAGTKAAQINSLEVAAGATVEWLPQETIIYNRAKAKMHTIVHLDPGAHFIGWEIICLGLPASNQPFTRGQLCQRFEIHQNGSPICIELFKIQDRDPVLQAQWGLAGKPVLGTMIATTDKTDLVQAIREKAYAIDEDQWFAVTRMNGLTICRFLGQDVYHGLKLFIAAWKVLRPAITSRGVYTPRIWAT